MATYRIASNEAIHAPGTWRWFRNARCTQPESWCREFLKAFTNNTISERDIEQIIQGNYTTSTPPETEVLVLVIE